MSAKLLNLFVNAFRRNIPRLSIKSGNQLRIVTSMEVANTNEEKKDESTLLTNKEGTRYKKRKLWGRRTWEEGGRKKEDGETDEKKLCELTAERIKKKKMVLLLGYCGVDYYGMQRNPGVPTIEEELLKALLEAKYITDADFENQQNFNFQRSSRTDKGVSAARQIVSLKLPLESNVEEINKRLPACIRVFGIKRVTNKFNSKIKCNARTYSYTLPTYVFEPSAETPEQRKKYRITPDKYEKVNDVLSAYKGTKNYHNFTEKKFYHNPSSFRYIMGFNVHKVFVESDMEFAVLLIKGQSFMLHQIRKMVGLAIAVVRGTVDSDMISRAFKRDKVMTPTAPGLGLVLDTVHYDKYDKKHQQSHVSLTWDEQEEEIQKFVHQYIYPVIVKGEIEDNNMANWLEEKLNRHSFEPSEEDLKKDNSEATNADDDDDDLGGGDDDDDKNDDSERETKENVKITKDSNAKEDNLSETTDGKVLDKANGVESENVNDKNSLATEVVNEKPDVDNVKSENSIEKKLMLD